jgi:hypothetical protein
MRGVERALFCRDELAGPDRFIGDDERPRCRNAIPIVLGHVGQRRQVRAVGKDRRLDDPQKMLLFGRGIFFHGGVVPQKRKTAQISAKSSRQQLGDTERGQWLVILEAAAGRASDVLDEDWVWLIDELGLPYEYLPAVVEAIAQGRWRTAKDPRSYVKVVARREARNMGLVPEPDDIVQLVNAPNNGQPFSMEEMLDHYSQLNDERYRDDDYRDDERGAFSMQDLVSRGLAILREPSAEWAAIVGDINRSTDEYHIHLTPRYWPDWEKWAEAAGFDQWDRLVLDYKRRKISRDQAMAEQPDEASRKAVQAAWRKFDRTGMERLRAVIKKVNPQNVPKS